MKVKLKFEEFRKLDGGGYVGIFVTPYGENVSGYIGNGSDLDRLSKIYIPGNISAEEVAPYKTRSGSLGLSVVFPQDVSDEELF